MHALTGVLPRALALRRGGVVRCLVVAGRWLSVGTFAELGPAEADPSRIVTVRRLTKSSKSLVVNPTWSWA